MEIQDQTSLKGLIQGMTPSSMAVELGTVISESPLKIQVINDDKLILSENLLCVPRHLSDYTTKCDITLGSGSIDSQTNTVSNHSHNVITFNIYDAKIKVYNALKTGDTVYLLSFNQGKKYYILDREVEK